MGIVLLVPVIWTALFHHRWESACAVAAIVAAEIVISLVQARRDGIVIEVESAADGTKPARSVPLRP